jgi:hypothetical protein
MHSGERFQDAVISWISSPSWKRSPDGLQSGDAQTFIKQSRPRISPPDLDNLMTLPDVQVIGLSKCLVSPGFRLKPDANAAPGIHYVVAGVGGYTIVQNADYTSRSSFTRAFRGRSVWLPRGAPARLNPARRLRDQADHAGTRACAGLWAPFRGPSARLHRLHFPHWGSTSSSD